MPAVMASIAHPKEPDDCYRAAKAAAEDYLRLQSVAFSPAGNANLQGLNL